MSSKCYMAIFVAVIVIVTGLIWYNASTISDIDDEVVTIKDSSSVVVEKDIDVLNDVDFEMDEDDLLDPENLDDMDLVDDIVVDEEVVF